MTKVSVCIPTYNQPAFVRRALESVYTQTFKDFEVIITDDSPADAVEQVVKEFRHQTNLRYYRNEVRLGSPENWNKAVSLASGDYIKLLHHDDWFKYRESLEGFVNLLDERPAANFAFSSTEFCSENEVPLRVHRPSQSQLQQLAHDPTILFAGNFIGAPTATIYHRRVKHSFDSNLKWLVDIDFYMRLLEENTNFGFSPNTLVCTRQSPYQVTEECANNKMVEVPEYLWIYSKLLRSHKVRMQHISVVSSILNKYNVQSLSDLRECGVDFPVDYIHLLLLASAARKAMWSTRERLSPFVRGAYRAVKGVKL